PSTTAPLPLRFQPLSPVATCECADYSPVDRATLANTPRASVRWSLSEVRALPATARMQSGNKAQKVLRPDKCPRTRSCLPPGESALPARLSSSRQRLLATLY